MEIRRAIEDDLDQIRQLFYETVVTINSKDYTSEQINSWASGYKNVDSWRKKIKEQYFLVAVTPEDNNIIGFGSLTENGYIDLMFVHKDHQGKGVAKSILEALEHIASDRLKIKEIWSDASVTARPFFESKGFKVQKVYHKKIEDTEFINSIMTKELV